MPLKNIKLRHLEKNAFNKMPPIMRCAVVLFCVCCRDWKAVAYDEIFATKATMDSDSNEC